MPAEWAPHAATWIAWPHNAEDWPGKFQPIPWVYTEIVRHLSQVEDVHILVNNEDAENRATATSAAPEPTSPASTFTHGKPTASGSATPAPSSSKIPPATSPSPTGSSTPGPSTTTGAATTRSPSTSPNTTTSPSSNPRSELPTGKPHRLVLEGGSIDTNGAGLLLTTEECLLSKIQERNPGLGTETETRHHLEQAFHEYLGIEKVLWLHKGCAGDDTHGHIDDITRFVDENKILTCVEPNTHDENHLPLAENLDRLRGFRNLNNEPFEIVELPMPSPVVFEGQRLPASYANFYIANALVLVPTFNDSNDRHALNIIANCFPDREIIGIHAVDLVWGLGTLHCLSQQEPA